MCMHTHIAMGLLSLGTGAPHSLAVTCASDLERQGEEAPVGEQVCEGGWGSSRGPLAGRSLRSRWALWLLYYLTVWGEKGRPRPWLVTAEAGLKAVAADSRPGCPSATCIDMGVHTCSVLSFSNDRRGMCSPVPTGAGVRLGRGVWLSVLPSNSCFPSLRCLSTCYSISLNGTQLPGPSGKWSPQLCSVQTPAMRTGEASSASMGASEHMPSEPGPSLGQLLVGPWQGRP